MIGHLPSVKAFSRCPILLDGEEKQVAQAHLFGSRSPTGILRTTRQIATLSHKPCHHGQIFRQGATITEIPLL